MLRPAAARRRAVGAHLLPRLNERNLAHQTEHFVEIVGQKNGKWTSSFHPSFNLVHKYRHFAGYNEAVVVAAEAAAVVSARRNGQNRAGGGCAAAPAFRLRIDEIFAACIKCAGKLINEDTEYRSITQYLR